MMTRDYNHNVHTFVLFEDHKDFKVSLRGPCAIILHVEDRVWVVATYADVPAVYGADMVQVGDAQTKGFDIHGNCIVSVSEKHVLSYMTDDMAERAQRAQEADELLLSYAR